MSPGPRPTHLDEPIRPFMLLDRHGQHPPRTNYLRRGDDDVRCDDAFPSARKCRCRAEVGVGSGYSPSALSGDFESLRHLDAAVNVARRILRSPPPHPDVDRRVRRQQTSGDVAPRLRGRKVFSESQDSFARFLRALDQHANARGGRA